MAGRQLAVGSACMGREGQKQYDVGDRIKLIFSRRPRQPEGRAGPTGVARNEMMNECRWKWRERVVR